jgi:hypothetical protein
VPVLWKLKLSINFNTLDVIFSAAWQQKYTITAQLKGKYGM